MRSSRGASLGFYARAPGAVSSVLEIPRNLPTGLFPKDLTEPHSSARSRPMLIQPLRPLVTGLPLLLLMVAAPSGCVKTEKPEAEPESTNQESAAAKKSGAQSKAAAGSAGSGKETKKSQPGAKSTKDGQSSAKGSEDSKRSPTGNNGKVIGKAERSNKPRPRPAKPVAKVPATPGDPEQGEFTLEEATKGLEGSGPLMAEIVTDHGSLNCELFEDKAPITVANFVGLARGTRAWKDKGKWVTRPLYDGTKFHRIIKGFMIQGGDPNGNGSGGPGFSVPDEIWEGASHSKPGLLCMANRGPNTNGSQFFILHRKALHLDGGYTIFGDCGPEEAIDKLASVPARGQRPEKPPVIKQIKVQRKGK